MSYPLFNVSDNRPIDLISMGRVAVDLYSEQIGSSLKDALSFKKYLGGCAGNIAVGTARLGLNTALFSCVGQDEMGAFLREELQKEGVNTELLYETKDHLTGLVLLGINPPKDFPLMFYRRDCADMQLKAEQITESFLAQSKALLITGTGLSTPSMFDTTMEVIRLAKKAKTLVIFDIDYRPVLWGQAAVGNGESRYQYSESVSAVYQKILPFCDLIVGTEEEILIAGGALELTTALIGVKAQTQAPIVVKLGAQGSVVYFNEECLQTKPFPVEVVNVLGAGDGFMAGLLSGLLHNTTWEKATTYANACGALVVTRHGCAPAIPYQEELDYFIEHYNADPLVWKSPQLMHLHERRLTAKNTPPLIKNPEGFNKGLNHIVDMNDPSHAMGMNFSVLHLDKGQSHSFDSRYEFAALLCTGKVAFHYEENEVIAERTDCFSQEPTVLHCPQACAASIDALTDCELLLIETENANHFAPMLFNESNLLESDNRGQGILDDTSYRIVRTVFDKRNRPESNLVVGEIITFQGGWSSYPSHTHDQPEIYHYRFSEPQGFAFAEHGKDALRIEHYDTYLIDSGKEHAHCTAPGYALYTLWFIRHLEHNPYTIPTFLKEHKWTKTKEANNRVWSKQ
jgi:5-dehydro-2-deoxygluconokinase